MNEEEPLVSEIIGDEFLDKTLWDVSEGCTHPMCLQKAVPLINKRTGQELKLEGTNRTLNNNIVLTRKIDVKSEMINIICAISIIGLIPTVVVFILARPIVYAIIIAPIILIVTIVFNSAFLFHTKSKTNLVFIVIKKNGIYFFKGKYNDKLRNLTRAKCSFDQLPIQICKYEYSGGNSENGYYHGFTAELFLRGTLKIHGFGNFTIAKEKKETGHGSECPDAIDRAFKNIQQSFENELGWKSEWKKITKMKYDAAFGSEEYRPVVEGYQLVAPQNDFEKNDISNV